MKKIELVKLINLSVQGARQNIKEIIKKFEEKEETLTKKLIICNLYKILDNTYEENFKTYDID